MENVPYYSQWESPKLVGKIVSGEISPKKDPKWKKSGASSIDEYELWSRNACGMACLKMILAHNLKVVIPIVELGKKCESYGGYIKRGNKLDGLIHKPFIKFINKEFGLRSRSLARISIQDIIRALKRDNYVIASVSREIRNPSVTPKRKGGHLVLLLGFDRNKKVIYLHNPSGLPKKSQKYAEISYEDFNKFFAGRGIVIEKN